MIAVPHAPRFFTAGNVRNNHALTFLLGIVALLAYLGFGGAR